MRTGFKQAGRVMTLSTPLGADDLLADAMQGQEGVSELFQFNLRMRSGRTDLAASSIVGKPVTVTLQVEKGPQRHVSGLCNRFVHSGFDRDFATYEAQLVPRLWLLTLSRGRRIYQGKSVDAIVKSVLGDFNIAFSARLSQSYAPLEYCVQYDESAFDFISRLMEQAGIFYFFTFTASGHTMVLGDAPSALEDCAGAESVRFFPGNGQVRDIASVSRFAHENALALRKATVQDYDFEKPSTALTGTHSATAGEGDMYEFATGHTSNGDGERLARLRVESSQTQARVLRGESLAYPFCAGTKFTLTGHFVPDLNAAYVLRRVRHTVEGERCANTFEALPASVPFRAPLVTPPPRAAGCETALVVGPAGEEIWTDKYGRIKVQFPWDREGTKDDKSSIWIRVAQSLAGPGFGALVLPRIGQEVVVSYLHGDPQRPLVTGCVYNGENALPVALPANQTQTVLRTRSSKQGEAGNELRLEDKKDAEQVYLRAQKDLLVEVENALTTTVKKGAQVHTLEEGDRTLEIRKGNETHKVQGTRTLEVTGAETHTSKAAFKHTVGGDYELQIDGKLTLSVTGGLTIKTSGDGLLQAGTALVLKAGTELTGQAGTNLTHKAGMKLLQQASMQLDQMAPIINSKADATQNVEAGAMLTLKGAMAKVN